MNRQEIFDTALAHLRSQGKPSLIKKEGNISCQYRDLDGNMCAVGALIPDSLYHPDMEECRAGSVFCRNPQLASMYDFAEDNDYQDFSESDSGFLDRLQTWLHDDPANYTQDCPHNFMSEVEKAALGFALAENLVYTEPN